MKKIFVIIFFVLFLNNLYSSNTKTYNPKSALFSVNFVTLSQSFVQVTYQAGNFDITVFSDESWTVFDTISWITVSPMTGTDTMSITIFYDENFGSSRVGFIDIVGNITGAKATLTVQQDGVPNFYLLVDPPNQTAPPSGQSGYLATVTSNVSWTASTSEGWITVNNGSGANNGNFTFDVAENTDNDSRTGIITIIDDDGNTSNETIKVVQAGQSEEYLTVDPDNKQVDASGTTFTATIKSNIEWVFETETDWLHWNGSGTGSGNSTLPIICDPNTEPDGRTGIITISGIGSTVNDEIITVVQDGSTGSYLVVSPKIKKFSPNPGNAQFNIISNVEWSISNINSWITITSDTTGINNGGFSISCSNNDSEQAREGDILILSNEASSVNVHIIQAGKTGSYLAVDPDIKTILSQGETFTAQVYSNVTWVANSSNDWIIISNSSLKNSRKSSFEIIVDMNSSEQSRTGKVIVSGDGVEDDEIIITQFGKSEHFIQVNPLTPNVSFESGNIQLEVVSNISWQVTNNDNWISKIDPSNGTGTQFVTVSYNKNEQGNPRQAQISFTAEDKNIIVTLTQDGNGESVSISGKVILNNTDNGLEGVILSFINQTGIYSANTDENGTYIQKLPQGWQGSVFPRLDTYGFNPEEKVYNDPILINLENEDYNAIPISTSLSVSFDVAMVNFCDSITLKPIVIGNHGSYTAEWSSIPEGFHSSELYPVIYASSIIDDTITYIVTINDGLASDSDSIVVITRSFPIAKNISGKFSVCSSQAGLMYEAENFKNSETYKWILFKGGTIINGKNTNKMVVNWGSVSGTYPLELYTYNRYGCKSSAEVNIEINTTMAPQASYVEQKSPGSTILIASDEGATSYLWGYYDKLQDKDVVISDSTGRYCQMPHLNINKYNYWVESWYDNGEGCKSRSYFNPPLWIENIPASSIKVFPNPASDEVTVVFPDNLGKKLNVIVTDISGAIIHRLNITLLTGENSITMPVNSFSNGVYLIRAVGKNSSGVIKFIKN